MEYLVNTLEQRIKKKMEILDLFEFFKTIFKKYPSLLAALNKFRENWDPKLLPACKNTVIAFVEGNWLPQFSDVQNGMNMNWKDFVNEYINGFTQCSVDSQLSPEFQPLNFREIVSMTFWEELFMALGPSVLRYIFDKCLIVFIVERGLFLTIMSPKYYLRASFSKRPFVRYVSVTSAAVFKTGNRRPRDIYKLPTASELKISATKCKKVVKRKLDRIEEAAPDLPTPAKIPRLHDFPYVPRKKKVMKSEWGNGTLRWITPPDDLLMKVKADREEIVAKYNKSTPRPVPPILEDELSFIGIAEDKAFPKDALDIIQKIVFQFTPSQLASTPTLFTKELQGIKIHPKLIAQKQHLQKVKVVVYKISISKALEKFNLKVIPRKRLKKKKSISTGEQQSTTIVRQVTQMNTNVSPPEEMVQTSSEEYDMQILTSSSVIPFDPLLNISTVGSLYNKRCCTKWSSQHSLSEACRRSITVDKQDSVKYLLNGILETQVTMDPKKHVFSIGSVYYNLNSLRDLLHELICFHSRIKMNIHAIVKNSLMRAVLLNNEKDERKQVKADWRNLNLIEACVQHQQSFKKPVQRRIAESSEETVGTMNTSATSSTHFSFSESPNNVTTSSAALSTSCGSWKTRMSRQQKIVAYHKLQQKIPHTCLLFMLRHVLHVTRVLKLLGSRRNQRRFFVFVRKSLFLAGVKSSLQLGELMGLLNLKECAWLNAVPFESMKTHIFAKVVLWIYQKYVLEIVRSSFYTTEFNSRSHMAFYIKESWKSVTDKFEHSFVKRGILKKISEDLADQHDPNVRMRLLPKKDNNVRPLISFTTNKLNKTEITRSCQVLNYLISRFVPSESKDSRLLAAKWTNFIADWRKEGSPPLFYFRTDIKDAFPSVNIDHLKQILLNMCSGLEGNTVLKNFVDIASLRSSDFYSILDDKHRRSWYTSINRRPCVILDAQKDLRIDILNTIKIINSILSTPIVRIGRKRLFQFDFGLPQGWRLSSQLCSIYYGSLEDEYFSEFMGKPGEMFIRATDDYFFISPDLTRVVSVANLFWNGFKNFGAMINKTKVQSNILVQSNSSVLSDVLVPFYGWNFNLSNGHVSRDLKSYEGVDITSTLSFLNQYDSPELCIYKRMSMISAVRLYDICIDPAINCRHEVLRNVYKAAMMMAFRFYAMCRVLYPKLSAIRNDECAKNLVGAICRCAKTISNYTLRRFKYLGPIHNQGWHYPASPCCIQNEISTWVPQAGRTTSGAIQQDINEVFRYNIIPTLKKLMCKHEKVVDNQLEGLKNLVSDKMPFEFAKMK